MKLKLFDAVQAGKIAEAKRLLAAGAKVDETNENGHSPLMEAASQGNAELVKLLLEAGADPKKENSLALDFAIRLGNAKCVQWLLDAGADPNRSAKAKKTKRGSAEDMPPVFEAVARGDLAIVEMLAKAGAKFDVVHGKMGLIALAANRNQTKLVDMLIDKGASSVGALRMFAQAGKSAEVKRLLTRAVDLEDSGDDDMSALALAAFYGRDAIVQALIEKGAKLESRDQFGKTPLCQAVSEGKLKSAQLLLDAGAKMVESDFGSMLSLAIAMEQPKIVELLLQHGADPNESENGALAPIFEAVQSENLPLVQMLLRHKGDPNVRLEMKPKRRDDIGLDFGATPLMAAAMLKKSKIVQALLEAGADPSIQDSKGKTAADIAAKKGDAASVKLLKAAGGSVAMAPKAQQSIALSTACESKNRKGALEALKRGADPNGLSEDGKTPLTWAAQYGIVPLVKALLNAGADPNKTSKYGESPLRVAALRTNAEVVRLLLDAGAKANVKFAPCSMPAERENTVYSSFESPLHDAAVYSTLEILGLLIDAGADVNLQSKGDCTPLIAAVNNRRMDSVERLLAAGATVRKEDSVWLSAYHFKKAAENPVFKKLVADIAKECGSAPEEIEALPGAAAFRLNATTKKKTKSATRDYIEAARENGAQFASDSQELSDKSEAIQAKFAEKVRAAGFLLIDAGNPIGCGPLTQFLALLPTNDKFDVMAAFGVTGNDQGLSTARIIEWFRQFDKDEPFELRGVKYDAVDIELRKLVSDPTTLAKRITEFCHDIAGRGRDANAKVAEHLRTNKRIRFWWD